MGTVTSSIYSTTAKAPMTRLEFSTDFQESSASVTVDFLQNETVVKTETYNLDSDNLIAKVSLTAEDMASDGTLTFAKHGNAVEFSGVGIWGNHVSFSATNVAIAYR